MSSKLLFSILFFVGAGLVLATPASLAATKEEIIVTTRKKEENLQEVPIAIDVFTAVDIERQGISSLKELVSLSPSL